MQEKEIKIISPTCLYVLFRHLKMPLLPFVLIGVPAWMLDQLWVTSMKLLDSSSCCPHSRIHFFPLPGLILRRCILDEEGIAYWEPPTYIKCVSIDYRNIQMMVRQTDFSGQQVWDPLKCLLQCYSYKKEGKQHFHVKGRCQLCPAFLLLFSSA